MPSLLWACRWAPIRRIGARVAQPTTTPKTVTMQLVVSFSSFILWQCPPKESGGAGEQDTVQLPLLSQQDHHKRWTQSSSSSSSRVMPAVSVNDTTKASTAAQLIQQGKILVYEGDYHNARQLLTALQRRFRQRIETKRRQRTTAVGPKQNLTELWNQQRQETRALVQKLNMLVIEVDSTQHSILSCPRRAPSHLSQILASHFGTDVTESSSYVIPLREVLGMMGAHEWERKGIYIPHIQQRLYPQYTVFLPTRYEYLDLLLQPPLPPVAENNQELFLMEVGVGMGVMTAVLMVQRNVRRVMGTDCNAQAVTCARDNLARLGFTEDNDCVVEMVQADVFPSPGTAVDPVDLLICNPPWIPTHDDDQVPTTTGLDAAVYDYQSSVLRRFLAGARHHVHAETGEVWLIVSTLAELLGLRSRADLMQMMDDGQLQVVDIYETVPTHPKAMQGRRQPTKTNKKEPHDYYAPIQAARAAEVTMLFRLKPKKIE